MVEVSRMQLDAYSFLGVTLQFGFGHMYIIASKHSYLLPAVFSMDYYAQLETDVAIIICQQATSFENLLEQEVLFINYPASLCGVVIGMKGKEALLRCESYSKKKKL